MIDDSSMKDGVVKRIVDRIAFGRTSYDPVKYWEVRAARPATTSVMWPNTIYNELVDRDEWRMIAERLPQQRGTVLDLGCGTGRMSARLAAEFDTYVGVDLATMVEEAARRNPTLASSYVAATVRDYTYPEQAFDLVLSLGCLSTACLADELETIGRAMVASVRPGGRILFVEPFHRSRLLTRGCRITPSEVIAMFEPLGMTLQSWTGMLFPPARLALSESVFEAYPRVTRVAYEASEAMVRLLPRRLSDYCVIAIDRS